MLESKCPVCNCKESKFLKVQEVKEFLSSLIGSKIPVPSDLPLIKAFFLKKSTK